MLLVRAQIALSVEISFSCRLFMNVHGQRADLLVIHELFYCRVVLLCISFSFCLLIEGGMEGLYLRILFLFLYAEAACPGRGRQASRRRCKGSPLEGGPTRQRGVVDVTTERGPKGRVQLERQQECLLFVVCCLFVVLFVATAKHRGGCLWWSGGLGVYLVFAWRLLGFCLVGAFLFWAWAQFLFFVRVFVSVLLGVSAVPVLLLLVFCSLFSVLVLLLFAVPLLLFRSCSSVLSLLFSRLLICVFRHLTEHGHPPI